MVGIDREVVRVLDMSHDLSYGGCPRSRAAGVHDAASPSSVARQTSPPDIEGPTNDLLFAVVRCSDLRHLPPPIYLFSARALAPRQPTSGVSARQCCDKILKH